MGGHVPGTAVRIMYVALHIARSTAGHSISDCYNQDDDSDIYNWE